MIEWIVWHIAMTCLKVAEVFFIAGVLGRDFFVWIGDSISEPYRNNK